MTRTLISLSGAVLGAISPLFMRPPGRQVAALCYRENDGDKEVLMITSRRTGRWIIPKGWPIDGLGFPDAALYEAWEEAGVKRGRIAGAASGSYRYRKRLQNGAERPCLVDVYPVEVDSMAGTYPESTQRQRRWVARDEAANMVKEAELRQIIRAI
ncbi:MAG: NUDIX hydrolase [Rhodobacteraceae bacterium]|nr:NUDIX hydrolase [Paracoccaceae bacterium]